jgi:sporulation protein YlmC with PRC-barrel domain
MTFNKLLATTAVVAITATSAYVVTPAPYAAAATTSSGYVQRTDSDNHFASDLIGATVYSSADPDAEAIGDVNDLVVSPKGAVDAVVIGVGGFLGLGEKNVAVPFEDLTWQTDQNGDAWPVLTATQEELEAAPAFERRDDQAAMSADGTMTEQPTRDTQVAMTDASDPAMQTTQPDQTAMAPANDQLTDHDPSMVSADNLIDTTVYSSDGENVGEVSDVLLTDGGEIDAIVIDVGGFLGIGEKPVAIAFGDLRIAVDQNENLILKAAFTRDQLDAAPEYDETAFRQDRDRVIVHIKS